MADSGARLLVAEDNKVNRLLLARTLQLQGHAVASADNGRVALEMLRKDRYDLLLLDITMPEMDGFQVLEHLKADVQLRDLPVIVTSALEGLENVVRCIELGAEDYLTKPVSPVLLRARINASLEKKRLRDQLQAMVRRFATDEVALDMQTSGFALGGRHVNATVMFSDIRGFTSMVEQQSPDETIELLNTYYTLMFDAISGHGGVVNQTIGDGLMAIFGAPLPLQDHPIAIGICIATGDVVAGYTGTQTRATYTCIGDTVNLAARLEAHTKAAGQPILLDAAAQSRLSADFRLLALGPVALKGKAQTTEVFAVPPRG